MSVTETFKNQRKIKHEIVLALRKTDLTGYNFRHAINLTYVFATSSESEYTCIFISSVFLHEKNQTISH